MADNETPLTQQELLLRQKRILDGLELQGQTLHQIVNGPASLVVPTESGPMPTLAGVVEEVRELAGGRRYEIAFFAEELARYTNGAEPLVRCIHTVGVEVPPNLEGSHFRLATPTNQPFQLRVEWEEDHFLIDFPANASVGTVTSSSLTEAKIFPAGTMVSMRLSSPAWTAKGLVVAIVAGVRQLAAEAL